MTARVRVARKLVYEKQETILYTDTTAATIFRLPAGAIPISVSCFTAATSTGATLDVGTPANTDLYIDGLDVSVLGMSVGTLLDMTKLTEPTDIQALIGGSPSSGGPFTIVMCFISEKSIGPK